VQQVIDRVVDEGTAVARSDGSVHNLFPVGVSAEEGEALRRWVIGEGATQTIEVGLGYGISALFICAGLVLTEAANPRHVVLDPNQASRFSNVGLQFLEDAGVTDLLEFHSVSSQTALPRFVSEHRQFDLAFVDGNHRFDGVFVDLVYLGRLVRPGGVIFLDDYQLPSIAKAASFFVTNVQWALEEISGEDEDHQWAVLRTSRTPDTRTFRDYFEF